MIKKTLETKINISVIYYRQVHIIYYTILCLDILTFYDFIDTHIINGCSNGLNKSNI